MIFSIMIFDTSTVYAVADNCNAVIPISIMSDDISATVTVEIFPIDSAPLPTQTSISLKNGQKGEFVIPYNTVGNFEYQVKETECSDSNIILDSKYYRVKVAVFYNENEQLGTAVTVYKNNEYDKSDKIIFENQVASNYDSSSKDDSKPKPDSNSNGDNDESDTSKEDSTSDDSSKDDSSSDDFANKTWSTPNTGTAVSIGTFSLSLIALTVIGISRRNNGNDKNQNDGNENDKT